MRPSHTDDLNSAALRSLHYKHQGRSQTRGVGSSLARIRVKKYKQRKKN